MQVETSGAAVVPAVGLTGAKQNQQGMAGEAMGALALAFRQTQSLINFKVEPGDRVYLRMCGTPILCGELGLSLGFGHSYLEVVKKGCESAGSEAPAGTERNSLTFGFYADQAAYIWGPGAVYAPCSLAEKATQNETPIITVGDRVVDKKLAVKLNQFIQDKSEPSTSLGSQKMVTLLGKSDPYGAYNLLTRNCGTWAKETVGDVGKHKKD